MSKIQNAKANQESLLKNFEANLQKNFDKLMKNIKDHESSSDCTESESEVSAPKRGDKILKETLQDDSEEEQLEIVSKFSEPENSKGFVKVKAPLEKTSLVSGNEEAKVLVKKGGKAKKELKKERIQSTENQKKTASKQPQRNGSRSTLTSMMKSSALSFKSGKPKNHEDIQN